MKNLVILCFVLICSILKGQTVFKHTAATSTITSNYTFIDNAATNGNPNAVLIVTSDYGSSGPYHNKSIGVWYTSGKWTIFNQDRSPMTPNAKFNVMVASPSGTAFRHKSTETSGHVTIIDHPSLNGNPNAKFLVTPVWYSVYNNNAVGIYYTGSKWAIYNQNRAAMPVGSQFNIVMHSAIFTITASAPTNNYYVFDNPSTNQQPNNIVFATQYWTSVYNANEIGVWYSNGKWSVFNQSQEALPANAKFMVISCPPSIQTLPAPSLVSPVSGSVFSNYPRTTRLQWTPVSGAQSYIVEVDCFHCCRSGFWCTDIGQTYKIERGITGTTYNFDFAGAQAGRWRVSAVGADGREGTKSAWFDFKYTR